jgi:hypothetical protein
MLLFRSQDSSARPAIPEAQFREVLRKPVIARELFLPADHAWWDGGNYTLGRWISKARRPVNTGVRLQEPRSASPGLLPEKDTQNDLGVLVESLAELRKVPELAGLVLSMETLVGTQTGTIKGKRLLFGLRCPGDGRFKAEDAAARECHRVMRKAMARAGYVVEHPRAPFDPATGLTGLAEWARSVRLRRSGRSYSGLLLTPLLFLGRRLLAMFLLLALLSLLLWFWLGRSLDPNEALKAMDKDGNVQKYFDEMQKAMDAVDDPTGQLRRTKPANAGAPQQPAAERPSSAPPAPPTPEPPKGAPPGPRPPWAPAEPRWPKFREPPKPGEASPLPRLGGRDGGGRNPGGGSGSGGGGGGGGAAGGGGNNTAAGSPRGASPAKGKEAAGPDSTLPPD